VIELLFGEEDGGDGDWHQDYDLRLQRLMVADTRNYVIIGDPAVYLPLATDRETVRRPVIEPVDMEALLAAEPLPVVAMEVPGEGAEEALSVEFEGFGLDDAAPYLLCNGVRADTGQYLLPPIAIEALAAAIRRAEGAARQDHRSPGERPQRNQVEF
jgi:hypothetical protein